MPSPLAISRIGRLTLALGVAMAAGCAGLPRIDPSGERFFIFPSDAPQVPPPTPIDPVTGAPAIAPPLGNLPAPPALPQNSHGIFGGPTIIGPAVGPAVVGQPIPVPQDRLTMTPERILAPVGSEVVLRSGLCTAEGYLETNRRIEWLLGQQGVGEFVEVSEEGQHDVLRWPWEKAKKIDNRYAVSYSSPVHNCLTRNAADPLDDLQIRPGDAWITVTSASEGTSYVTAYDPQVEDWSARKATAVIYWVDAQWQLPAPATVELGQPHTLTTTLTRRSDGTPIAGWIVRYEVADGAAARLGYEAGQVAEATTNAQGQASVEISPTDAGAGTSNLRVTIVRPASQGTGGGPQIDVGSGDTSVTWASGLPATGLPPIVGEPTPQPTLPPDDLTPAPVTPIPTGRPDLTVLMQRTTADPIRVGDTVSYNIVVRNNGDGPARNIVITERFESGLQYPYDPAKSTIVYSDMRDLGPGDSDQIQLEFKVLEPGRRSHDVTVSADDATDAYSRDSFEALPITPPRPTLDLAVVVPRLKEVGDVTGADEIRGVIRNTGSIGASNVTVRLMLDSALQPTGREPEQQGDVVTQFTGGFQWQIPRIEPRQTRLFRVQCRCVQPADAARVQMFVTADGGFEGAAENETRFEIRPRIGQSPAEGAAPPPAGAASNLGLQIASNVNPAQVNRPGVLKVFLQNNGAVAEREVVIEVFAPAANLQPRMESIQGPTQAQQRADGVIEFAPIATLPPGAKESILIPYQAIGQGNIQMQARVRSQETPQWINAQDALEIRPR